jgi:hypothetical protein
MGLPCSPYYFLRITVLVPLYVVCVLPPLFVNVAVMSLVSINESFEIFCMVRTTVEFDN